MKGAKGGNRDRIISWLFSERTRKKREEALELEQAEEIKTDEKNKERRKDKRYKEETIEEVESVEEIADSINYEEEEPILVSNKPVSNHDENVSTNDEVYEVVDINDKNDDKAKIEEIEEIDNTTLSNTFDNGPDRKPPTLFIDEDIVEEIKEQVKAEIREKEEKTYDEDIDYNHVFPEVLEVSLSDEQVPPAIEKPELLQISIIEEIDNLLRNDDYDLRDIKYKIEVLNEQQEDEVLLENIEKIQKELEELIKRFNEIKKKYDYAYSTISIKDIDAINDIDLGASISDYIVNGKNGIDNSNTLDQIQEIEEFIDIINNIIEIEKQKDIVEDSVDNKLVDFSIRDEEFIKLQDQYANIDGINSLIDRYNSEIDAIFTDLDRKIDDSVEITRRIEATTEIVPNLNRMMQATVLLASTQMIPPTPAGNLFRASLFVTAAHMMATAFTPRTEEREVVRTTVTDYSKDIINSKGMVKGVINDIDNAFSEISYMKDTFEKELGQYRNQIPEYDKFIKNIFAIEKELERQQFIAYDYSNKFDYALVENNQKVKRLENE